MGNEEERDKAPQVGVTAGPSGQVPSSRRDHPTPVFPALRLKSAQSWVYVQQGSGVPGQISAHRFLYHLPVMRTWGLRGAGATHSLQLI